MKIKLDDAWVCSICGSVWEPYGEHGQGKLCSFCGADSQMEDLPLTAWNWNSPVDEPESAE